MPTFRTAAEEWAYWDQEPPPHAARAFPSLNDAIRPDHAEPAHLADLAATLARAGGRVSEAWQWADPTQTLRRIRTWGTLWRLGVIRPVSGGGVWTFILADRDTIAADAEIMTAEDRKKALAYGEAVHSRARRAAILDAAANLAEAQALAALGRQTQPAEVLSLRDYRRQRDALRAPGRRHAVPQARPQDEAEVIAL